MSLKTLIVGLGERALDLAWAIQRAEGARLAEANEAVSK